MVCKKSILLTESPLIKISAYFNRKRLDVLGVREMFEAHAVDKLSGKRIQAIELQGFLVTLDTDWRVSIGCLYLFAVEANSRNSVHVLSIF